MFKLTCIDLDNGGFALYINGHYVVDYDFSGQKLSADDLRERLELLPGVELETVSRTVPAHDDWSWNDVAGTVFACRSQPKRKMTIRAFKERLSQYQDVALCCGTFWLAEDFLALDNSLSDDDIEAAMECAHYGHDAGIGYNWDSLQAAIDEVNGN